MATKRGEGRYAWALRTSVADTYRGNLAPRYQRAVEWAQSLALDPSLTIEDAAREEGISTERLKAYMGAARRELFGTISYSAIRARDRRWRGRKRREQCAEEGCTNRPARPIVTSAGRKPGPWPIYCEKHATSAARTARSRRKSA